MMKEETAYTCNLCGANNQEVIYRRKNPVKPDKEYKISEADIEKPDKLFKCNVCGLIFAEQRTDRYYLDAYGDLTDPEYVREEAGRRRSSIKILDRIERIKRRGKLLDIGCANGFFLDEARRKGWDVCGVELSKWAVGYARNTLKLNVMRGTLQEASFPSLSFDVIVMLDVLEHLTDPKGVLIEVRRILKDDGLLLISTPDITSLMSELLGARWWGINKYHLYYFSKVTLAELLAASGFSLKKSCSHTRTFSLSYWAARLRPNSFFLYSILNGISKIGKMGSKLFTVDLRDQIEVSAVKARSLNYLVKSLTEAKTTAEHKKMKVFVVLPAYNAEKTLKRTVDDIPRNLVEKIILTDDKSSDKTVEIAKSLGLEILLHKQNKGYGANQKTCYRRALELGADIIVMVHPDYQYDPALIPSLIEPIQKGEADAVFGSRMLKGGALKGGMPLWKQNINILLTAIENITLGTFLSEYHTGFRAYSANLLKTVKFELNSDKFLFDTEIIVQALIHHFRIEEVPIKARYFDEASSIKLIPGAIYCFGIIKTMIKYLLHVKGIWKFRQFE